MSAGDIRNNLKKLQNNLKRISYPVEVDYEKLIKGSTELFLPLLHHALNNYSPLLAKNVIDIGIELSAKTDARFVDGVYKVCREIFSHKPLITKDQFLSNSFAERKVIMCSEIIAKAIEYHQSRAPKTIKQPPKKSGMGPRCVSLTDIQKANESSITNLVRNPPIKKIPVMEKNKTKTKSSASLKKDFENSSRNCFEKPFDVNPTVISHLKKQVEVINICQDLPYDSSKYADNTSFESQPRLIDAIATTPARIDPGHSSHSSFVVREPDQVSVLEQRLKSLETDVTKQQIQIEVQNCTITKQQKTISHLQSLIISQENMENILAKMTLLENRVKMLENQKNSRFEESYLNRTAQSEYDIVYEEHHMNKENLPHLLIDDSLPKTSTPLSPVINRIDMSDSVADQVTRISEMIKATTTCMGKTYTAAENDIDI